MPKLSLESPQFGPPQTQLSWLPFTSSVPPASYGWNELSPAGRKLPSQLEHSIPTTIFHGLVQLGRVLCLFHHQFCNILCKLRSWLPRESDASPLVTADQRWSWPVHLDSVKRRFLFWKGKSISQACLIIEVVPQDGKHIHARVLRNAQKGHLPILRPFRSSENRPPNW